VCLSTKHEFTYLVCYMWKLNMLLKSDLVLIDIIQRETETPELERGAVRAIQDLYDVMRLDVLSINMRFVTIAVVCIH